MKFYPKYGDFVDRNELKKHRMENSGHFIGKWKVIEHNPQKKLKLLYANEVNLVALVTSVQHIDLRQLRRP